MYSNTCCLLSLLIKTGEKNSTPDTKIGSLDLETFGTNVAGLGELSVYAGGCAIMKCLVQES